MKKHVVLVLLCGVLVAGCSRNEKNVEAPQAVTPPERSSADRAITLSSQRQNQVSSPPAAPLVRESRPVQQRDKMLSLRGGEVYSPEDYEIGALQSYSEDENIQIVLSRIRSFQEGLASGTVRLDDVHPDWKDQAQRSLGFHLERGHLPLHVRIGVVDIYVTGKVRVNIRLIGEPGVAFGEIYLDRFEDTWLVSDLQVDMADLAEAPAERDGLYEPSIYRMTNLP